MQMKIKEKLANPLDKICPKQKRWKRDSLLRQWGYVKKLDDIVVDPELAYDFIDFFRRYELEQAVALSGEADERYDDYLLLLEELDLVRIDWKSLKGQRRPVGHRFIKFFYQPGEIQRVLNRIEDVHGSLEQTPEEAAKAKKITEEIMQPTKSKGFNKKVGRGVFTLDVLMRRIIVRVDGKTYLLATPRLNGINDNFFQYVFNRPQERSTQQITRAEIERAHGGDKIIGRKVFHKIVLELGFRETIKRAFFPSMSEQATLFRKSVSSKELAAEDIDAKLLLKELEAQHEHMTRKKK